MHFLAITVREGSKEKPSFTCIVKSLILLFPPPTQDRKFPYKNKYSN